MKNQLAMIKKGWFVLLFFFCTFLSARAQKNVIKWNYLSLVTKTLNFGYERALGNKVCFQLQGWYWMGGGFGERLFGSDVMSWEGYGFTPEIRYYPSGTAPKGFFVAPFYAYRRFDFSFQTETVDNPGTKVEGKASLSINSGGVAIGYQAQFGSHVTWDVYIGPRYNSRTISYDGEYTKVPDNIFSPFGIRMGTTLGVCF